MKNKILAVIPARYSSSRFEGKPLALINGTPMIMWVFNAVKNSGLFDRVLVATDDIRIFSEVKKHNGDVIMTSSDLTNGTQRCAQVLSLLEKENEHFDIVINIQGDEPLIKKEMMCGVIDGFSQEDADIVTLKKSITDPAEIKDPNVVKVVTSGSRALYFSRSVIPYKRDAITDGIAEDNIYFKHIGIYGYKSEVLKKIVNEKESLLEKTEKLEQLRWLENGYKIIVMPTEYDTVGVDTPEDLKKVIDLINK